MANYTQLDELPSNVYTQRLLNNGSDYIAVAISDTEDLYIQGRLSQSGSVVSYIGESWILDSSDSSLTYNSSDAGQITITDELYVYSSLKGYQKIGVRDVFPHFIFCALIALLLVIIGFNVIRKRWIL